MNQESKISGFQFKNPILTKLNYNINPVGLKKLKIFKLTYGLIILLRKKRSDCGA